MLTQIGDLADAGERMIERLRRKAFLPESRKGLNVRFGIAEAAQLLGCSALDLANTMRQNIRRVLSG